MSNGDRISMNKQLSATQAAFVIVVGIGVLLRLLNLSGKVFWIDEAFTALRISGFSESDLLQAWNSTPLTTAGELLQYQFPAPDTNFINTIRGLATWEPQLPPLYFVLTRWWVQVLGDSVATIRSFSAIASIATLPMVALLSRELFATKATAYIAVALMSVSPFQVLYAQEARPYSLWTLGTIAMSWALLRALRSRTWQAWLVYGILTTLTLYTFIYTAFVLLAHGFYVVWQRRSHWRPFWLAGGASVLLFLPWVWAIAVNYQTGLDNAAWQFQTGRQRAFALPLRWLLSVTRNFADFEQTYPFSPSQLWPYGLVVFGAIGGVGYSGYRLVKTTQPDTWKFLLLLLAVPALGVILPDVLLGGQQSTATRYFVPCGIALSLIVANALALLWQQRFGKWVLAGVLTLGLLSCMTNLLSVAGWHKTGSYLPFTSAAINATPKPLVISGSDVWILSMAHYLLPETPVLMVPKLADTPGLPTSHSHYFLYSFPEPWQQTLSQNGFQLASFEQLDQIPLRCLFLPGQPVQACPPESSIN